MKALELSKAFFKEFGLPAIKQHYPGMVRRVSAGYLGQGSEIFCADDELSRDHGWGPRFILFLSQHDHKKLGRKIEQKLNGLRPAVFRGVDFAKHRTQPIQVTTIDDFYSYLTGAARPPKSTREWTEAVEESLFQAQAGEVLYDPVGKLRERKRAFDRAYYPKPIWQWRVASRLYRLWHYGDYNFRSRLVSRRDIIAATVAQGHFVEAAMQLAFLLNRRFCPYWKWLSWTFRQLPYLAGE